MSAAEYLDSNAVLVGWSTKQKRGASLLYNGAWGGVGLRLKHMLSVTNNGCKTKGDNKMLKIMGLKRRACQNTGIFSARLGGCCIILMQTDCMGSVKWTMVLQYSGFLHVDVYY